MDRISPEKRSEVMSSVRAKDTKLELLFLENLEQRGLDAFERYSSDLPGSPDFAHDPSRIAIFIDSCFWHGCKQHLRMPKSNQAYWLKKIARNRRRDREVTTRLREQGWLVLRIWEHSVKNPRALKWWLTRIGNLILERQGSQDT